MRLATGNSKTKWNGNGSAHLAHDFSLHSLDVCLSYQGKRPEKNILAAQPIEVKLLWRPDQEQENGNHLYYGNNFPILASLLHNTSICGKVKLVYIDPPFATKSIFQSRTQNDAYGDLLDGAHYLEFMRERLIMLRELLAEDGSIYVHLDENMAFHLKVIMDEVFGRGNFRNWITRKKCNPKNFTRKTYGNISDFILFYTKSDSYIWHRSLEDWTAERAEKEYQYVEKETGRRYKKVPVHAPGVRNGETGKPWRGKLPPPGKHWQFSPQTLDEMDARGEIYWSPTGNPRRKVYFDDSDGIPVQDIWMDFRDAHNQNIEITGYPTEKNPNLLARIITASSNPGDIVLDCFSGSGTTLAVASHLKRKWIGVDNSTEAITTTLRRFAKGLEPMGDFVNTQKISQKEMLSQASFLWDNQQQNENVAQDNIIVPIAKPGVINDFSLYAADDSLEDMLPVVEQWRKWL